MRDLNITIISPQINSLYLVMRSILIVGLILSLSVCAKAQMDTTSVTWHKIQEALTVLQKNQSISVVCFYWECTGGVKVIKPDSCNVFNTGYLIWESPSGSLMQKFDECKDHKPVTVPADLFQEINQHLVTIKKEEIKPPEYEVIEHGKKNIYEVFQDHTCDANFIIYSKGMVVKKTADAFFLETKRDGPAKLLNRNYARNHRTTLSKLVDIMERNIKKGAQ